jgi:tagatose 6-phosphate kinase
VGGTLLCVSIATSLDRYVWTPALRPGTVNRPTRVVERPGGKAFNVAHAAGALGLSVRVVAQIGGHTGPVVRALAERERMDVDFVLGSGNTRQCLCVLDESSGVATELYEPVPPGTPDDDDRIREAVDHRLAAMGPGDVLAVSGRVAAGRSPDLVAALVRSGSRRGVRVVVDSVDEALGLAVAAEPGIVKVNEAEARTVVGGTDAGSPSAAECARRLAERSGGLAIVTAGASGAWACAGDRLHHLGSEPLDPAYPIGSGDAFVAGLVAGMWRRSQGRAEPETALVDGTAASRVNLRTLVAGQVGVADWEAERRTLAADP